MLCLCYANEIHHNIIFTYGGQFQIDMSQHVTHNPIIVLFASKEK